MAVAFVQTALGARDRDIDLFAFSDAAIAVEISVTRTTNIELSSVFDIATDGRRFRDAAAAEESQFDFDTVIERSREFQSETQAAFSFDISDTKLRPFASNLTSTTEFSAIISHIEGTDIVVNGFASLSAELDGIKTTVAALQTTGTVFFNGGKRQLAASALTAFGGILVSRNAGTDRPKTVQGTFTNLGLRNSSTRITDFSDLPQADNWFIEFFVEHVPPTNITQFSAPVNTGLFDIPLGTLNGAPVSFKAVVQRNSQGHNTTVTFLGGGGQNKNIVVTLVSDTRSGYFALSFTGGQRVAVYHNGIRQGVLNDWPTAGWTASVSSQVAFAPGYPFVASGQTHNADTRLAFASYGNFTSSGAASYEILPRINTPETIFLYKFSDNQNGTEDVSLSQFGAAGLQSTVSSLCSITVQNQGQAAISASSSVVAVVGKINQIDLVAFDDAELSATATRIKSLASDIASDVSVSADAVKTTDTQSNIESVVSQTTTVSALRDAVITTESVSAQISAVVRLAGLFADDLCEFNLTTEGVRTASAQSSLQSESQTEVTAFRIKENPSALESSATLTADAVVVKVVDGNFSSDFAQSAAGDRIRSLAMSAVSVSEVSATGNNLGKIECTLVDAVTVTADVEKITDSVLSAQTISTVNASISVQRNAESSLSVNASQSVVFDRFRNTSAALEVVGSKLVAVVKQAVADIDVNVVSTVSASVEKIAGADADIDTSSSVSGTVLRLRTSAIALAVESTVIATGFKQVVEGAAVLQAAAAKLIAIAKTSGNSADVSVTSSMVVAVSVSRDHAANIDSVFTQASTVLKILSAQSNQSADSSVSITPTVLIQGNAVISSAMVFVSQVREIRLDDIVYVIPGEIFEFEITSETRQFAIGSETRIHIIQGD
jgi:hypothetical protein